MTQTLPASLREKPLDRFQRWLFNIYPAHWFSGGRMQFISSDYRHCRVYLRKNWRTRGLFGNIFGGNLYAGIDAMPMALLQKRIGHKRFVLWDKTGEIRYVKPAYCKLLIADIHLPDEVFGEAMTKIGAGEPAEVPFSFSLTCPDGKVYATVHKTIHVECRKRFNDRKQQKSQRVKQPHDS